MPGEPGAGRAVCFDDRFADDAGLLAGPLSARAPSSSGPAVIEEYGATVPLHPGFSATVDALGNLHRAPRWVES